MSRSLIIYPSTRCTESELLRGRDAISLCMMPAEGGDFLAQCGVWEELTPTIHPRPIPPNTNVTLVDIDGYVTHDRIRPLHYCTAGEFNLINRDKIDNSKVNAAILAYLGVLNPDTVVFVYIS